MCVCVSDPQVKDLPAPSHDDDDDDLLLDPSDAVFKSFFKINYSRGGGVVFGPAATHMFLKRNNLELLIRSHQVC